MSNFSNGIWLSKVVANSGGFIGLAEAIIMILAVFKVIDLEQSKALHGLIAAIAVAIAAMTSEKDLKGFENAVKNKEIKSE